jgi:hypothetical protein
MIFRDFFGALHLALHQPNSTSDQRAVFISLQETDGKLQIDGTPST